VRGQQDSRVIQQTLREAPPRTAQASDRPGRDGAGGFTLTTVGMVAGGWTWVSRSTGSRVLTVNDVLDGHTVLDLSCLDRLYLSGFVQKLQTPGGGGVFPA
jgi:hypothetical protein